VTNAWWDRCASLRATAEAPSVDPKTPDATSTTAALNHTRRVFIGPTLSLLASNGKDGWGVAMRLTSDEPSEIPLAIPK
jgi:hypothetical protein